MIKFIHAADVHLDSPLVGLERYDGAPVDEIRGATRRSLENLVGLAVEEHVDFVLIAGDLYDGDWKDYNTGLFLARQMARLREAEVGVYVVAGNHDAASVITKSLRMPDNVTFLSTERPETILVDRLDIALHGQGFPAREVTEDLSVAYPDAMAGIFNIGLLHTSADGRSGHEPYAPCTLDGLRSKGYDYWALGHVHAREVLSEDPWIVFPGNMQGRHVREAGPKGASLVTVEDGSVSRVEHRDLDVVRWSLITVDVSDVTTADSAVDLVRRALEKEVGQHAGRTVAARVILTGDTIAHKPLSESHKRWVEEIRAASLDLGDLWIEKVRINTRMPLDLNAARKRDDPIGATLRLIEEIRGGRASLLDDLVKDLSIMKDKLPHEYGELEDAIDLGDAASLAGLADRVEQLLIARFLDVEETR